MAPRRPTSRELTALRLRLADTMQASRSIRALARRTVGRSAATREEVGRSRPRWRRWLEVEAVEAAEAEEAGR